MNRSASPLVALVVVAVLGACQKQEKPKVRTEPWPAPVVSASSGVIPGATIPYVLDQGSLQIELRGKKQRRKAELSRLEGSLAFDPARPERTRGQIRADLLDLKLFDADASEEDATLTLAALRALELTAQRNETDRERERWADLRVVGFEVPAGARSDPLPTKAIVKTFVELTMHRFRVPTTVDVQIETVRAEVGGRPRLRVRTQRPLSISLVAHDILPRDSGGNVVPTPTTAMEGDFGREARVSADLSFIPASQNERSGEGP